MRVKKRKVFKCPDCDNYRIEASYTGGSETTGREHYEAIDLPSTCPVCGGTITVDEVGS